MKVNDDLPLWLSWQKCKSFSEKVNRVITLIQLKLSTP